MQWLINRANANIVVVTKENWPTGKLDPTQYNAETDTIEVREDYDFRNDPAGWIVHEQVHAQEGTTANEDYSNYPNTLTEQKAFGAQFKFLMGRGIKQFDALFSIPGFEHEKDHYKELKKIWESIQ